VNFRPYIGALMVYLYVHFMFSKWEMIPDKAGSLEDWEGSIAAKR